MSRYKNVRKQTNQKLFTLRLIISINLLNIA